MFQIPDRPLASRGRLPSDIDGDTECSEIECPLCGGDGKETCDNPDHGFIALAGSTKAGRDINRNGCPGCGHDPNHKVPNGGDCEMCEGRGVVMIDERQLREERLIDKADHDRDRRKDEGR